jgi:diguanylate cyclase (GGDEF)-like protein/PAS domain S-box-containing protein
LNIEEQFHKYFNLGLIGMAITSPDKGWLRVNDKLCEIFGYSREELFNLTWAEITHPDDLDVDIAEFNRVMQGKIEGYSLDKRFINKKGDVIYASISANCIRKDDGSVNHFVALVQDITERKLAEIKLQQMNADLELLVAKRTKDLEEANQRLKLSTNTDFLTNISNRKFHEQRLGENISTAQRNDTYLALLMIDIDDFKPYNDTYGHDNGDIALCKVANSIASSLSRDTDLVSRYGGEEFVVLLPSTDEKSAFQVAEKIRKNIELLNIEHSQSFTGFVTASIGIDAMKGDKLNKKDLFKHADLALYLAKDTGKNRSCLFTSS